MMSSRSLINIPLLVLCLLLASSMANATVHRSINTLYKDPKQPMNVRIKVLMNQMTLEEKIGQMAMLDKVAATPDIMRDYSIGSLISGPTITPHNNLRASPQDWVDMVNDFQNGSLSSRLGIPYIYGIDSVHGHGNVYQTTIFPHNIGLGATRDPQLVQKIGAATAIETRATGIPYVFAPCIAVCVTNY